MREAWLFALAYLSHLPDTVDFVMSALLCELSNKKRTNFIRLTYLHIFVRRGRGTNTEYRHFISCARSSKCCCFTVTNVGKYETFPAYSCFLTMDSFWFEEIVTGNGVFQDI